MNKQIKIRNGICRILGVCLLVHLLAGCNQRADKEEKAEKEVEIPVIFQVDPASHHRNNEELIEAFNQEYQGKYKIKVQWMYDTTNAYRSQIKLLNATDELPAVFTDVAFSPSFLSMLEASGRLVDFAPELAVDDEWCGWLDEDVLSACYEEDGSLYIMPISSNCFSFCGIFYNKKLFAQAGIETFPKDWEEFWICCERLQRAGITPLSLHTEGTGWAPMLLATAYIGTKETGRKFLSQRLPDSYDGYGEEMGKVLAKAFSYTTDDAVNQDFDIAYEHFIREETAMLPNGYWMLTQLEPDFGETMGFAPFPGNVLVVSPQMSAWAAASNYSEEVRRGAVEFLRFRTRISRQHADEFLDDQKEFSSSLEEEYLSVIKNRPQTVSNYQIQWNPVLQEKILPQLISKLARKEMDAGGFEQLLNDSIKQLEEE